MNIENQKGPTKKRYHFNEAIIKSINATHFISFSLCQWRAIPNAAHGVSWLKGDDTIYNQMHVGFVESLSKRLATRTVWKYHRPILRSVLGIEGGNEGKLVHGHMIIAKPDAMGAELFCNFVQDTAAGNRWIKNGDYAVHIKSLDSFSEKGRSAYYTTKDGFDRLSFT